MTTTVDGAAVTNIADIATAATEPAHLDLGGYYTIVAGGSLHKIDLTGDQYLNDPKRKRGTTTVRDVASFAAYWAKHMCDNVSEVYADRAALTVTAVLNAHAPAYDQPGWGDHRVVLALTYSTAFAAWRACNGRDMSQEEFAEFLEDNRADIYTPAAAEMLEVAQSIQAVSKVDFASGFRLVDGQRRLTYTETMDAKAGQKGELAIPAEIVLRLPIFDGATHADQLLARFRHRLQNGQLRLSYKLDRPDDVVTQAFEGIIADVTAETGATVLRGTPA